MRARCWLAFACVLVAIGRAAAEPAAVPVEGNAPSNAPSEAAAAPEAQILTPKPQNSAAENSLCLIIESAALAHDLPVEFFARVIWQESRFRTDAVGPRTRSGLRAQGIAQFMPGTAAERGLL